MILYLAPGACSLADHIALHEAGLNFDQVKVDLKTRRTAILSWISDQSTPALFGDFVRYRLLEALAYVSTDHTLRLVQLRMLKRRPAKLF
jgi:hypothetical protein